MKTITSLRVVNFFETGGVNVRNKSVNVNRIFATYLLFHLFGTALHAEPEFVQLRQQLVEEIRDTVKQTSDYTGRGEFDEKVIQAIKEVPRHEFVPHEMRRFAYLNQPLPIGNEQTISQPYIVALMTDLAGLNEESRVLEIGTGSGYQAAVLSALCAHVYSVEIIETLGLRAQKTLKRLNYHNVDVKIGDGYQGWEEHAPYDAILVTAAPEHIPDALIEQLRSGGKLVIPVGRQDSVQSLKLLEKNEHGEVNIRDILPVGFVPLTREKRAK